MKINTSFFIFALTLVLNFHNSFSQYSHSYRRSEKLRTDKMYMGRITFINDSIAPVKNILFQAKDSSIVLSNSTSKPDYILRKYSLNEYSVTTIDKIKIFKLNKRRNYTINGGLIGAAALGGFTLFVLSSGGDGSTGSPLLYAITFGAAGFIAGGTIGFGLGSAKIKIPINGKQSKYDESVKRLRAKALLQD